MDQTHVQLILDRFNSIEEAQRAGFDGVHAKLDKFDERLQVVEQAKQPAPRRSTWAAVGLTLGSGLKAFWDQLK